MERNDYLNEMARQAVKSMAIGGALGTAGAALKSSSPEYSGHIPVRGIRGALSGTLDAPSASGLNVKNYPGGAALNYGDQRLGYVDTGNGSLTFGIDNMGNPNRGAYDGGFNTPVGRVNYGYDGDTVYGQIEPAYYLQALANLLSRR